LAEIKKVFITFAAGLVLAAAAIAVSGSRVCVAGYESNAARVARAAYWRNGFQSLLIGGKTRAYAHGIAFGGTK
jgi:hypothetical protein